MRISDWSSDVCSSDLIDPGIRQAVRELATHDAYDALLREDPAIAARLKPADRTRIARALEVSRSTGRSILTWREDRTRSEEHTSELQSLMRISYAVFCLKKKKSKNT